MHVLTLLWNAHSHTYAYKTCTYKFNRLTLHILTYLSNAKTFRYAYKKHLHINSNAYLLQISNQWVALMSSTQGVAHRVVASPTFWPGNRKWTACISQSRTRAFSLAPLASIPSRSDTQAHMKSFQERHRQTSRAATTWNTLLLWYESCSRAETTWCLISDTFCWG